MIKRVSEEESEILKRQHHIKALELQLREKDKEGKLCELKLKEIRRQTRHKALKPINEKGHHSTDKLKQYKDTAEEDKNMMLVLGMKRNQLNALSTQELTESNVKLLEQRYQNEQGSKEEHNYQALYGRLGAKAEKQPAEKPTRLESEGEIVTKTKRKKKVSILENKNNTPLLNNTKADIAGNAFPTLKSPQHQTPSSPSKFSKPHTLAEEHKKKLPIVINDDIKGKPSKTTLNTSAPIASKKGKQSPREDERFQTKGKTELNNQNRKT